MWRFRGTPHYLGLEAARLGVTQVLADRARNNPEIYRISVLLSQLCERFHKARKEDGKPVFGITELAQVKGTLQQCEQECAKLHALAAAAGEMIDDAWAAYGLAPDRRRYEVMSDFDTPRSMPFGENTETARSNGTTQHATATQT